MLCVLVVLCACGFASAAWPPSSPRPPYPVNPDPTAGSKVSGPGARITVLREGLCRLQLGTPEEFDDRATFQVVNRRWSLPDFRDISAELPPGSTGVATPSSSHGGRTTPAANLSVVPAGAKGDFEVSFSCRGRTGWKWHAASGGGPEPGSVEQFGMPISRRGIYVLDDTKTARLAGGNHKTIDWWQLPKVPTQPGPPPAPLPLPPPSDTCTAPHIATDCAPNQAKVVRDLKNVTQAECCAACNKDKAKPGTAPHCSAWVYGPAEKECWLQSYCGATVHNPARVFGGAADWPPLPAPPPPAPTDLYFMCYGDDHQQGMYQLTTVTGTAPLMPSAAYGVWYSGCCMPGLYNSTAVRQLLLAEYKRQDLPLDMFVLDFFWHRRNGWGGYSWDRQHFPDGEALVASLRDGSNPYGAPLKLLNNHHPNGYVITPSSEDHYVAFADAMGADPAQNLSFPCDFYDQDYVTALQTALLARVEDFPWIDCVTCGVHAECGNKSAPQNLDFNLLANYAFDAQFSLQNKRSLTLNRLPGRGDGSNYNDSPLNGSRLVNNLGAHRYPGAWTGDVGDGFADLANSVSLFPAAFAGHFWGAYSVDLGPYADGLDQYNFSTNGVRYVRYMQWGVWSAIFRPHDGGNDDTRIWMFAEPYASILRDCTRLRGALTPYVYFLAAKSSYESWPYSRPMWWDYGYTITGSDTGNATTMQEVAWEVSEQYMFGDVLVHPVTAWAKPTSGNNQMNTTAITTANVSTWLPAGEWSSWDGHTRWSSIVATRVTTEVQLADTPLFVRAGAVIAMWPPGRRATSPANRTKVFALWPAVGGQPGGGSGTWYEDDGESLDYRVSGGYASSDLSWAQSPSGQISINISSPTTAVPWSAQAHRIFAVQLRGLSGGIIHKAHMCSASVGSMAPTCHDLAHLSAIGGWTEPGWWSQTAAAAESAVPTGAVVVVLPPLALNSVATLHVIM